MSESIHSKEYANVVRKLREARDSSGLTQFEVATKLNKPQSYVSKIECGERRVDVVELTKLADLYSKTLNWFVK